MPGELNAKVIVPSNGVQILLALLLPYKISTLRVEKREEILIVKRTNKTLK